MEWTCFGLERDGLLLANTLNHAPFCYSVLR